MPFVDIEDSHVEYRAEGAGPGLVLVHGAGLDADRNWGSVAARLSQGRTVVRPNYSGSGTTADRGGPLTLERLGRQVIASAWAVGAAPFDLVGFALGAGVAAYIAATTPDLVRSLVLIAGFADANDAGLRFQLQLRRDLAGRDRQTLARLMILNGHAPGFLSRLSDTQLEQKVAAIVEDTNWPGLMPQLNLELGLDLRHLLPGIACPTLVVVCEHDQAVPPFHGQALAATIPDAEIAVLPTGHLAAVEQPEALAAVLEGFVQSGSRGTERAAAAPARARSAAASRS
jgi:pimeloyl-ACP methyl ester carboxylesterase